MVAKRHADLVRRRAHRPELNPCHPLGGTLSLLIWEGAFVVVGDVLGVGHGVVLTLGGEVVVEGLGEQVVLVAGDHPLATENLGELPGGHGPAQRDVAPAHRPAGSARRR